jgi:hypothetical protein
MKIEICKPTPEQAELQNLFAEVPSKEAIERATYLLNNYSKDSEADIICLALSIDRRLRESKQHKDILDQILREFPVGNIAEHTIESLPERISYYLKELAEYTQRVEDWEECADRLSIYAEEIQCTVTDRALWEVACEDVAEYKRLKNETT